MKVLAITVATAAVLLVACEASAPTQATDLASRAAASQGVVAHTSGGGQAQLPAGFSLLSFAFNAKVKANGDASGQFHQVYESASGTVDFHGTVTCVSFDAANGRAWIGGVITKNNSTNPAVMAEKHQVGHDIWFRVVDNGEGQSPEDRTTVFGFEGAVATSAEYCANKAWTANDANTWAAINGNIQVRP